MYSHPAHNIREAKEGLTSAIIAFTKGKLSKNELWAEIDYAATCFAAAGYSDAAADARAHYKELTS